MNWTSGLSEEAHWWFLKAMNSMWGIVMRFSDTELSVRISCPFIITRHTVIKLEEMGGRSAVAQYNASLLMSDDERDTCEVTEVTTAVSDRSEACCWAGLSALLYYGSATSRGVSGRGRLSKLSLHNSIDSWVSKNSSGPSGDWGVWELEPASLLLSLSSNSTGREPGRQ